MTTNNNRCIGEADARTKETGHAEAQPTSKTIESNSSTGRPLFHPLRWRGAALIEFALLLEWLALAAVIGLLMWGAR